MNFGARNESVGLLEELHLCKLSILIGKIRAVATKAKCPAATSLDLLLGRMDILSKADPWAILFNRKGS